jgi:hypothetical protein
MSSLKTSGVFLPGSRRFLAIAQNDSVFMGYVNEAARFPDFFPDKKLI